MSANTDGMIRSAVQAFKQGNKAEARHLLEKVVEIDQYSEKAWLWLSAVVETTEEQRICLENVLAINPDNNRAEAGLKSLGFDPNDAVAPEPEPPASSDIFGDDDFGNDDFGDDDFGSSNAFTDDASFGDSFDDASFERSNTFTDTDESNDPFTDVNFVDEPDEPPAWDGIATSSASTAYNAPQPSDEDYDSWVDSLNLGKQQDAAKANDDPFGGQFEAVTDAAAFDDDDLTSGPFATEINEDEFDNFESAISQNPREAIDDTEFEEDAMLEDDLAFDDDMLNDVDLDDDLLGTDFATEGDEDEEFADLDLDGDYDDVENGDLHVIFAEIPAEIKPGRLPGTSDSASKPLMFGVGVMALLNVGAVIFLVLQFL